MKSWLPSDFGAFAGLPQNRKVKVTGAYSHAVHLPDGSVVRGLKKMGEGHATFALGKQGHPWVYLVTDGKVDDPAKKIMASLTERIVKEIGNPPAWSHHLPWIEFCGKTTADSDFHGEVHRSPPYMFFGDDREMHRGYPWVHTIEHYAAGRKDPLPVLEALRRRAVANNIPAAVLDAIVAIWQQAKTMFPRRQFVLEFPAENVARDTTGTVVLADIIFDAESVSSSMAGNLAKSSGLTAIRRAMPAGSPVGPKPKAKPKKAASKKKTPKPKKAVSKKAASKKKKAAPKHGAYGWFPTTSDILGKRGR